MSKDTSILTLVAIAKSFLGESDIAYYLGEDDKMYWSHKFVKALRVPEDIDLDRNWSIRTLEYFVDHPQYFITDSKGLDKYLMVKELER